MHVKKGEKVIVLAGNDKGRTGEVVAIINKKNRVIVAGVNMLWKHKKPTQDKPKGERVQEACSVHSSNVALIDPTTGKGTRKRPKVQG